MFAAAAVVVVDELGRTIGIAAERGPGPLTTIVQTPSAAELPLNGSQLLDELVQTSAERSEGL